VLGIAGLITGCGSSQTVTAVALPIDVWIDHHHVVRRLGLMFAECVSGRRIHFSMTMDLYDYGPQARPSPPRATQVQDITQLVAASLHSIKFGCTSVH
jgi:hypothetical protein